MPDLRGGSPELSIVIPCLNEAETLGTCISKAQTFLREHQVLGEIVVADNGSTDGSQSIARDAGARIVNVLQKGYGSALMGGIAESRGKYVIMGDADDSYDFLSLEPFLEKLRSGYDLVMGNRFKGGIKPGAMPWLHRYLGNPVLSGIGHLFFKSPFGDFHCGLRGFHRDVILKLDLKTTGMEFASEMLVKATLRGLKLAEVPTVLSPDGRSRPSHLHTWRDGWRHLRFLLLFSPRWLFLYPGMFLMLMGTATGVWLLPGPRHVGNVVLDVHTLLFSAAGLVVGFQAVTFSFLAKIFAVNEHFHSQQSWTIDVVRSISLELGLILGISLIIVGLGGSVYALVIWQAFHFGPLDPSQMLRIVIPCVTAIILGFQTAMASFFLSFLQFGRRN